MNLYQVYEPSEVHGVDFEQSAPTTIEDAFSQAAKLEAEEALLQEEHYIVPDREPHYVVQPSPWGLQ